MINYTQADDIQLVHSGDNYFEILEEIIDNSREVIHLQTYIFGTDGTGRKIIKALERAAERKVSIYILADAFGSHPFSASVKKDFEKAGIHFRLFSPLFSSESIFFGRRLHHKIIVTDKKTALIGGINIADKYHGGKGQLAWLDYAIKIQGSCCESLHKLCIQFYEKRKPVQPEDEKFAGLSLPGEQKKLIRFRRNDWLRGRNEIHKSYAEALINANRSIVIVASYFLPGRNFRKLLVESAERGIDIKIIIAGKSDMGIVRLAENYLFSFYLLHKIKLFKWKNSVMHGKAMLVDRNWATIGSYNLNFLSHYISIELNADVQDPDFISEFSGHLDQIMRNDCETVVSDLENKKRFGKLKMLLAYNALKLIRGLMMLSRKYRKNTSN